MDISFFLDDTILKYNEKKILGELIEHIKGTYQRHYVFEGGLQALDMFAKMSNELAVSYCYTNALKYLMRYGKKEGKNKLDLLKAMHCIMLMIHFEHYNNENSQENKTPEVITGHYFEE